MITELHMEKNGRLRIDQRASIPVNSLGIEYSGNELDPGALSLYGYNNQLYLISNNSGNRIQYHQSFFSVTILNLSFFLNIAG